MLCCAWIRLQGMHGAKQGFLSVTYNDWPQVTLTPTSTLTPVLHPTPDAVVNANLPFRQDTLCGRLDDFVTGLLLCDAFLRCKDPLAPSTCLALLSSGLLCGFGGCMVIEYAQLKLIPKEFAVLAGPCFQAGIFLGLLALLRRPNPKESWGGKLVSLLTVPVVNPVTCLLGKRSYPIYFAHVLPLNGIFKAFFRYGSVAAMVKRAGISITMGITMGLCLGQR